ncbi:MAG: glycoside hydrolase family 20 zincin-like fold domain-containing protein [Armatimonadota bacterium]
MIAHNADASSITPFSTLRLLPYPQQVERQFGTITLGPPNCVTYGRASKTEQTAIDTLKRYLPKTGEQVQIKIGSLEEGYNKSWITPEDHEFLAKETTSPEASVLNITPDGITVVGKNREGMLYGVQTINQLAIQAQQEKCSYLPCLSIRDWPDMQWRCLSPTLTWYSGYNRLEGYDLCNWTVDEWKWLADWSLLHKCNAWAVCMYGYWPFTVPGHESNSLDVDSFRYNPKTGKKEPWRFTHRNITKEFLPELIRYANDRGVAVHAYIGKNSFNGTYWISNPEMNGGGAAELLPFAPGVSEYWNAVVRRILEIGFDGFVFEDPEAYHVPNSNDGCYKTFWEPWASTYGFSSVADTDPNKPPLGVHIEYYSWLFRQFDEAIAREAERLGRKDPVDIYLISHILLSRIVNESKTPEERTKWLELVDEKQGRKVPFVIFEGEEQRYVDIFGGDRVATLGGRGGSCTCAMRRIASINNDWSYSPMAADVDYERDCQTRMFKAGGFGAMGYIFEWTNTEVFGYIASQYLWHNAGVPGIDEGEKHKGFLEYAYRHYYGDEVGPVAARAHDMSPCVNDAMILDGVNGSQFPETGKPLHRDFQYLSAQSDKAWELARQAYRLYTGKEPNLYRPVYKPEQFKWDGFDIQADNQFKAERLRLLCVSAKRSQWLCEAALAHRLSQRPMAEGALVEKVLQQLDKSINAARENQKLYQVNYDDDYDWTDGLCAKLTAQLESLKDQLILDCGGGSEEILAWSFDKDSDPLGWTEINQMTEPIIEKGVLSTRATSVDACIVQKKIFEFNGDERTFVEIEMVSDHAGMGKVYWAVPSANESEDEVYPFSESRRSSFDVKAGERSRIYRAFPSWNGKVTGLRLDIPYNADVKIHSIRILKMPEKVDIRSIDLKKPVTESVRERASNVLNIPWEKLTDIVPGHQSAESPGTYLSCDLGLNQKYDFYRLGVTFTVQAWINNSWRTIFRRSVDRRTDTWEHWDIPLSDYVHTGNLKIRMMTDSYSRAQDRNAPQWNWALWGQPEIMQIDTSGNRKSVYSLTDNIDNGLFFVRLDSDGNDRAFDGKGEDSTGAAYRVLKQSPLDLLRNGEGRGWQWVDGFDSWVSTPLHRSPYRCYLGSPSSGWVYAREGSALTWLTAGVPSNKDTAIAFIGGTDYNPAQAELWCNGKHLLDFNTGSSTDLRWSEGGVELRYIHGGDIRDERTTFGLSGIFILRLPADMVSPGKPLELSVRFKPGDLGWFMVHEYKNTLEATQDAILPGETKPSIAAFTPHNSGQFGVTIAEYDINIADSLKQK